MTAATAPAAPAPRAAPLPVALAMWGIAALFYLLGFFFRVTPGVLNAELMRDFGLNAAMLGNMAAFYYYGYASMQVPTGLANDRFGPKALIVIGALACGLGGVLFANAHTFAMAAAGRALMGIGHGMAWVSMLSLAAAWFAPRHFGLMSGLSLAVGTLGAVLAQAPLRIAADALGWRPVIGAAGVLGLVLAVVALLFVRRDPSERGYAGHGLPRAAPPATAQVLRGLLDVWRYRNTLLLFAVPGGVCGALLTFTTLWGTPFLVQHQGLGTRQASNLIAAMLLAFSVGSVVFGRLSDRWQRRKRPYFIGALLMLGGFGLLAWRPGTALAVLGPALVLAAFGSGAMVVGFAFAKESVPAHLAGTATGVHNMGVMLGTLVQLPLLGSILDAHYTGALLAGVRQYDLEAFRLAFAALAAWVLFSVLCLLLARDTRAMPLERQSATP
ncbi:MAG: MFS transporter [Betaproteobacteria bacterium]|nr:MFS transporter [Betaproteobacteria bacterium]